MDAETEIIELARTYERSGVSTLESYKRVLRERPDLAQAYESKGRVRAASPGDDLDFQIRKFMANSGERDYVKAAMAVRRHQPLLARRYDSPDRPNAADAKQQLGALLSDAIASGDIDGAISTAAMHRSLCIAVAGQWFEEKAAEMDRNAPAQSGGMLEFIQALQRQHPAVTRMWNSGAVSEEALYSLYPQWFNDSV